MNNPPPHGQNPYGQPQAGAAPYGQNPYGQAPHGQPPVGGYPGGAPVPPPAPGRGGGPRIAKGIFNGIVVVAVAAIAIAGFVAGQDDADTASTGDCVINRGTDFDPKVEVVDCGSSEAEFTVAEKHDGEASCDRSKFAQYSEVDGSDTLFTLCLEPYKK